MSKAINLEKLKGFNVPKFEVLDYVFLKNCSDDELKIKIFDIVEQLDCQSYAIRSSANVEDSKEKSYAGIFDSYIDIDKRDVFMYVKKVFEGVNDLKSYTIQDKVEMSVIIQEYIPAKYSGVAFTNLNNQFIISVVEGRCEKLVSGELGGEDVVLDRESFCFFRKPKFQLDYSYLIKTFLKIENMFKLPQDIEWVLDKENKLYIVQTRPITTN